MGQANPPRMLKDDSTERPPGQSDSDGKQAPKKTR